MIHSDIRKDCNRDDAPDPENEQSRAKLASTTTDWETSWRRARFKGIGSDGTSFLSKMLHNLLPTEARLSRILPNSSDLCQFCPTPITADLPHCLFSCVTTREVGHWLLFLVRLHDPSATAAKLVRLEFYSEDSSEMPIMWILAHTLLYMWDVRASGKIANLDITRPTLESKLSLLQETRFTNEQKIIREIMETI